MHALVSLSLIVLSGPAQDLRLIRTESGAAWMTPGEVMEMAAQAHRAGHCGGFFDITEHPHASTPPVAWFGLFDERQPTQASVVEPLLVRLQSAAIEDTVRALSAMHDRYYNNDNGEAGAKWIADAFVARAGGRKGVSVEFFNHSFRQPSVIARLPGKGPHAQEVVVLGAHQDSINWEDDPFGGHGRAPGADDDASGVAVLLEVFRVLASADYQPQRTIEFMAYAGEELGLLGSQDIAEAYHDSHTKVVAVLQMDMTMFPAKTHRISFVTDNTSSSLNRFAARLVDRYVHVPHQQTRCGYGCSDHAAWHERGYPTVFPFETAFKDSNPHIHSTRDTLAHLDAAFGLAFAKLNTAFAVELAAP